jgi:hypothetical protein
VEEEEKLAMKEKVSDAELLNFDLLQKKNFGEADDEEQLSNRWVLGWGKNRTGFSVTFCTTEK